jgi:hypothetical protein
MFVQALLIALASPCFARRSRSGIGGSGSSGSGGTSLGGGIIAAIVIGAFFFSARELRWQPADGVVCAGIVTVTIALSVCCCCRFSRVARSAAAAAANRNPEAGQPMTQAEGNLPKRTKIPPETPS